MVQFKELKSNNFVYILDNLEVEIKKARIATMSIPHLETKLQQQSSQNYGVNTPRMVIDFGLEVDGRVIQFEIPESNSVAYANNMVIATELSLLKNAIEAIISTSDQYLENYEKQKLANERAKALLPEVSPEIRERQKTEDRLNKIEGSVDELKGMFKEFMQKLS